MGRIARQWSSQEELENSPTFQALIVASAGKPERSMGDSVIPAEPPQWRDVYTGALAFLDDSPMHLTVLITYIKAEASLNGYVGMFSAFTLLSENLQEQWDTLYPLPDPDDPDDPFYGRINILRELSDEPSFIDTVYRMPLVDVRGIGSYSIRDLDISAGTVVGSEEDQSRCQDGLIRGAFKECDQESLQELSKAIAGINAACATIETLFVEKGGSEQTLSLANLTSLLDDSLDRFIEYAGDRLKTADMETDAESVENQKAPSGDVIELSMHKDEQKSSIRTRMAVSEIFTQIILYYQLNEPASPVAVLACRARDMVTKPFFGLVQDLAPSHKDSFSSSLSVLIKNPLAYLMEESYRQFLTGENQPTPVNAGLDTDSEKSNINEPAAVNDEQTPVTFAANSEDGNSVLADSIASIESMNDASHLVESGKISSREQVLKALAEIDLFFHVNEPSSPIPLVISEMRKLAPKTFIELVAEFSQSIAGEDNNQSEKAGNKVAES
ncbi:MAG: type VI secretion system ImpA family N-terminal domain-containing protein [Granulosicoccus sp.]